MNSSKLQIQRTYHVNAWCDRPFTASFVVLADSPEEALRKAKEQVHDAHAEECDNGYPWDTFTIDDESGAQVASESPPSPAAMLKPVRELLEHIEDLGSEFSICREISQSSYFN